MEAALFVAQHQHVTVPDQYINTPTSTFHGYPTQCLVQTRCLVQGLMQTEGMQ